MTIVSSLLDAVDAARSLQTFCDPTNFGTGGKLSCYGTKIQEHSDTIAAVTQQFSIEDTLVEVLDIINTGTDLSEGLGSMSQFVGLMDVALFLLTKIPKVGILFQVPKTFTGLLKKLIRRASKAMEAVVKRVLEPWETAMVTINALFDTATDLIGRIGGLLNGLGSMIEGQCISPTLLSISPLLQTPIDALPDLASRVETVSLALRNVIILLKDALVAPGWRTIQNLFGPIKADLATIRPTLDALQPLLSVLRTKISIPWLPCAKTRPDWGKPQGCPEGYEKWSPIIDTSLCYQKCLPGYNPLFDQCFRSCPAGRNEIGPLFCSNPTYAELNSKPAKVDFIGWFGGQALASCPEPDYPELIGVLCFKKCRNSYVRGYALGVRTCYQNCPPGMVLDPVIFQTCVRPSYRRNVIEQNCPVGSEKIFDLILGDRCYQNCPPGESPAPLSVPPKCQAPPALAEFEIGEIAQKIQEAANCFLGGALDAIETAIENAVKAIVDPILNALNLPNIDNIFPDFQALITIDALPLQGLASAIREAATIPFDALDQVVAFPRDLYYDALAFIPNAGFGPGWIECATIECLANTINAQVVDFSAITDLVALSRGDIIDLAIDFVSAMECPTPENYTLPNFAGTVASSIGIDVVNSILPCDLTLPICTDIQIDPSAKEELLGRLETLAAPINTVLEAALASGRRSLQNQNEKNFFERIRRFKFLSLPVGKLIPFLQLSSTGQGGLVLPGGRNFGDTGGFKGTKQEFVSGFIQAKPVITFNFFANPSSKKRKVDIELDVGVEFEIHFKSSNTPELVIAAISEMRRTLSEIQPSSCLDQLRDSSDELSKLGLVSDCDPTAKDTCGELCKTAITAARFNSWHKFTERTDIALNFPIAEKKYRKLIQRIARNLDVSITEIITTYPIGDEPIYKVKNAQRTIAAVITLSSTLALDMYRLDRKLAGFSESRIRYELARVKAHREYDNTIGPALIRPPNKEVQSNVFAGVRHLGTQRGVGVHIDPSTGLPSKVDIALGALQRTFFDARGVPEDIKTGFPVFVEIKGGATFDLFPGETGTTSGNISPTISDANADRRADVLCQRADGKVDVAFAKAAPGTFQTPLQLFSGQKICAAQEELLVADINFDQRVDILCFDKTSGTLKYWLNGQAANTTNIGLSGFCAEGTVHFADLNGDGADDAICSTTAGAHSVAMAKPGGLTTNPFKSDTGAVQIATAGFCNSMNEELLVTDLDGDKKNDLVCVNVDGADSSSASAIFSNINGPDAAPLGNPVNISSGIFDWCVAQGSYLQFANIDGRSGVGRDLVCSSTQGNHVVRFWNETAKTLSNPSKEPVLRSFCIGTNAIVMWLDVNGDGADDAICKSSDGIEVSLNNNGVFGRTIKKASTICNMAGDLIVSSQMTTRGPKRITTGTFAPSSAPTPPPAVVASAAVDMVCRSADGEVQVATAQSMDNVTGGLFSMPKTVIASLDWCGGTSERMNLFDIDNDGYADYWCDHGDGIHSYRQRQADGSAGPQMNVVGTKKGYCSDGVAQWARLQTGSLPELICSHRGGSHVPLSSFISGANKSMIDLFCGAVQDGEQLIVADFNGDSLDDFVCVNRYRGYLSSAENLGNNLFLLRATGVAHGCQGSNSHIQFGDINGDGMEDIICSDGKRGLHRFSKSLGNGLFDRIGRTNAGICRQKQPVFADFFAAGVVYGACRSSDGGVEILEIGTENGSIEFDVSSALEEDQQFCASDGDSLLRPRYNIRNPDVVAQFDIDGDGKGDLVCNGKQRELYGDGSFVAFSNGDTYFTSNEYADIIEFCNGPTLNLYLGDFSGTGRTDLMCFEKSSGTFWVAKNSNYREPRFRISTTTDVSELFQQPLTSILSNTCVGLTVRLADVDGDGGDDVLCTSDTGRQFVVLSDKDGEFEAPIEVSNSFCDSANTHLGDVDGDFSSDILCIRNNQIQVGFFTGTNLALEITTPTIAAAPCSTINGNVKVIDVDNDGLADIVCHVPATGKLSVQYGLGGREGMFSSPQELGGPRFCPRERVYWLDVNGDGYPDAVCPGSRGSLIRESFTGSIVRGANPTTLLNDDGKMFSLPEYDYEAIYVGNFCQEDGASFAGSDPSPASNTGQFLGHVYHDADNDGRADPICIVHTFPDTGPGNRINYGRPGFVGPYYESVEFGGKVVTDWCHEIGSFLQAYDVDGDGHFDLICHNQAGGHRVRRSDTQGGYSNEVVVASGFCSGGFIRMADHDGDGLADMLCTSASSMVQSWYRSAGSGTFTNQGTINTLNSDIFSRAFLCKDHGQNIISGHLNGDSKADIICALPTEIQTGITDTNGDFVFSVPTLLETKKSSFAVFLSIDMNGDGFDDLVCNDPIGGVNSYLPSNGDGTFGAEIVMARGWCRNKRVMFLDTSKDGYPNGFCVDPHPAESGLPEPATKVLWNIRGTKFVPYTMNRPLCWIDDEFSCVFGSNLMGLEKNFMASCVMNEDFERYEVLVSGGTQDKAGGASRLPTTWGSTSLNRLGSIFCLYDDKRVQFIRPQAWYVQKFFADSIARDTSYLAGWCQATEFLTLGDLNGDGLVDFQCHSWIDGFVLTRLSPSYMDGPQLLEFCYGTARLIDFDGDGFDDIFCQGLSNQGLFVALSTGEDVSDRNIIHAFDFCPHMWAMYPDLNGDGRADLLCIHEGNLQSALNLPGMSYPSRATHFDDLVWCTGGGSASEGVGGEFQIADVDGDGLEDIVCDKENLGEHWVRLSNGDGTFGMPFMLSNNLIFGAFGSSTNKTVTSFCPNRRVVWMDLNADGLDDVVCRAFNEEGLEPDPIAGYTLFTHVWKNAGNLIFHYELGARSDSAFNFCYDSSNPSRQHQLIPRMASYYTSGAPPPPPSSSPSLTPSSSPSEKPSPFPSEAPSETPSEEPSPFPSEMPSEKPSQTPSLRPSLSFHPSTSTQFPSELPTSSPSESPSVSPSTSTQFPSKLPTSSPSESPSRSPSPSQSPSSTPSVSPNVAGTSVCDENPDASPIREVLCSVADSAAGSIVLTMVDSMLFFASVVLNGSRTIFGIFEDVLSFLVETFAMMSNVVLSFVAGFLSNFFGGGGGVFLS